MASACQRATAPRLSVAAVAAQSVGVLMVKPHGRVATVSNNNHGRPVEFYPNGNCSAAGNVEIAHVNSYGN